MTVTVTQEHIEQGTRGNCWGCPLALALQDAGYVATVSRATATVGSVVYRLPLNAIRFVNRFDRGHHVKPETFEITEPLSCTFPRSGQ